MSTSALPAALAKGRYSVTRLLGEGSEKRVYLGHDTILDRDVAIAVIRTPGVDESRLVRLRREARAMGQLGDHPHVVTVYDVGEEDGQPFIVSQYMAGGTVENRLHEADGRRLPLEQALRIADQVSSALAYAHEHGVIHRDLKPSNVWLTRDGTAKLGDFGLAAVLSRSSLTLEGMMVGTVSYMAPEQALGRPPDARSDFYALGAMLYEMVTGRPPFLGDDAIAIISQHINTPPVAPSWHNPQLPRDVVALILRLLAKLPEERPQSAAAIREALAAIASTASGSPTRVAGESPNPLDRLAGGVFVGREPELRELRTGLEDALSGQGWLLLLVGEPGIGKTRTAEEFVIYAQLRKAQVLWGRCHEGEGAPPYWPWVQAIRSFVHNRDPKTLLAEMGSGAADIAQVVPAVRERLPSPPSPPAWEPEHARFRLFDSITTFLRNAAKAEPIVIVLDDLHWADKASLLLLQFVARELRGARLLVLGTYRDVELGRQHPLSQTLAELAREKLSRRIFLRGLTERDVARFIEIAAGLKPPAALVSAVYRETEGNPFFVNEVVRLLVSEGHLEAPEDRKSWSIDIPQSAREVVGRRLDRLSPECNLVLRTAAVVGRGFGIEVLEQVTELRGDRLLDVLDEAMSSRVIAEVPRVPGRYTFAHVLIRETLYSELPATRRVRLHRRIGEVLEARYGSRPEPHLAELAYHFFQAALGGGDLDRAVDYARRAGDRATAQLAHEEAVDHYAHALEALELREPCDESQRCDLLLALGGAQARAGDIANAKETFLRAAEPARRVEAPEQLARAALGFGQLEVLWRSPGYVDEALVRLLEEALGALPPEDGPLRARLLGRLAVALYWSSSGERRETLSRQAVEMAERSCDAATRATVLGMRHTAIFGPDNPEERLAIASELLRLAREAGDHEAALEAHRWRLTDLLELGDVAAVDREIDAYDGLARKLRQPLHMGFTAAFRAMRALMAGRFAEAEALTQEALALGQRFKNRLKLVLSAQMAQLCRDQGRLEDLRAMMSEVLDQAAAQPAAHAGMALTLCNFGKVEEARTAFERLAANDFADLPRDFSWLVCIAALVETCAFLGDSRRAAILYRLLLPYAPRNIAVATGTISWGPVAYYLGRLAATMGRHDEAEAHFEHALEMSDTMGARPFVARTQHAYATVLAARDERRRALEMLNRALETARELGMNVLVKRTLAEKLRLERVADPMTTIAS